MNLPDLGADIIVGNADLAALARLDRLAGEFNVKVAIENRDSKAAMAALESRSRMMGIAVDTGAWMQQGIQPADGLALVKSR